MSKTVELRGVGVGSHGTVGNVWLLAMAGSPLKPQRATRELAEETAALTTSIATTVSGLRGDATGNDSVSSDIMEALLVLVEDSELLELARPSLEQGWDGATALQNALDEFSAMMGEDEEFQSRVGDLMAIGREIGSVHRGETRSLDLPSDGQWILVAKDLTPLETSKFGPSVVGVITEHGGPTSHTAIICRARNLPAVVGCHGALTLRHGSSVLLDPAGDRVVPSGSLDLQTQSIMLAPLSDAPLITVRANIGSAEEGRDAAHTVAQGVGLFRTEVLYLNASDAPSLDEQQALYREVFLAAPRGKIIVRTIDAGSDKPVPFLPVAREENPALGVRGFRMASKFPEFAESQLRAIAGAVAETGRDVGVMAPMVSTVEEVRHFASLCHQAGITQVGIMVETPAIISVLPDLCGLVSFLSIGTNDLSQYLFAADRLHPELSSFNSPWQPGLFREIKRIVDAGEILGVPVGVCGESGANPLVAIVLAGLGIHSVSAASSAVNDVASALQGVTKETAQRCASAALAATSPEQAHSEVRAILEEL
jgi:phosphotransferase system enzyme I (PtsI)